MINTLQALIFDCDGVLVDTERDGHRVAFNRAFFELGIDCNWSVSRYGELLKTAGGKERIIRHFNEVGWPASINNREGSIRQLHKVKTEIFMELIEAGKLPLRPGVQRLVDEAIAAGVSIAVCSTSNEHAVMTVVRVMLGEKRAKKISIFAGDVVPAKKPDPAIYTLAARTLGAEPSRCLVIEDSHIGLMAASSAGMNCIVTTSSYTQNEDFSLADLVVSDLDCAIDLSQCRRLIVQRFSDSSP